MLRSATKFLIAMCYVNEPRTFAYCCSQIPMIWNPTVDTLPFNLDYLLATKQTERTGVGAAHARNHSEVMERQCFP